MVPWFHVFEQDIIAAWMCDGEKFSMPWPTSTQREEVRGNMSPEAHYSQLSPASKFSRTGNKVFTIRIYLGYVLC